MNGEAVYGTRPWRVFGEGPTEATAGAFQEGAVYTPKDIRFTTKGGVLYAIVLGVPTGDVRITTLARGTKYASQPVAAVQLLGSADKLTWSQEAGALVIQVPAVLPSTHACAFKIAFGVVRP